jgi:hypothetical protein
MVFLLIISKNRLIGETRSNTQATSCGEREAQTGNKNLSRQCNVRQLRVERWRCWQMDGRQRQRDKIAIQQPVGANEGRGSRTDTWGGGKTKCDGRWRRCEEMQCDNQPVSKRQMWGDAPSDKKWRQVMRRRRLIMRNNRSDTATEANRMWGISGQESRGSGVSRGQEVVAARWEALQQSAV